MATTIELQQLIDDQLLASNIEPAFGPHDNQWAGWYAPNQASLVAMCSTPGQANGSVFPDYVNSMATWFWFYRGDGNTRTDKRLQFRNIRVSIQRESTGLWEDQVEHEAFISKAWTGNDGNGVFVNHPNHVNHGGGLGSSVLLRNDSDGAECWPTPFYNFTNRGLMADCRAMAAVAECRVVDGTAPYAPYYGSDAIFAVSMGVDQYNSNKNTPGSAGDLKDSEGRPKNQMDGGNSRWRPVTGGDWQKVGFITLGPEPSHLRNNPFQNYTGSWPYQYTPYTRTEAQVRGLNGVPSWVTSDGSGEPDTSQTRKNYCLYSDDANSWDKTSITVTADGAFQTIANTASGSGIGITQHFPTLPAGPVCFSFLGAPKATDWVAVRLINSDFSVGAWRYVNLNTGEVGGTNYNQGGFSGSVVTTEAISGGYKVSIALTTTSTGWGVEIYPCGADGEFDRTSGDSVNLRDFQMEDGSVRTYYKPTTTTVVTRTLTNVSGSLVPGTIGVSGVSILTVGLSDDQSDPWDQFSGITVNSSDTGKATVGSVSSTNVLGNATCNITGVAAGTSDITATAGGITSDADEITVTSGSITLDQPTGLTVTRGVSGTNLSRKVTIGVSSVDSDATDVKIEYKVSTGSSWSTFAQIPKGSLPYSSGPNLIPGVAYDFRVSAILTAQASVVSSTVSVTMYNLYVHGYFDIEALGVTNCQVAVGRGALPSTGLLFPTEIVYASTGKSFGASPVTVSGVPYARMIVSLTNPPSNIAVGEAVDMMVRKSVGTDIYQSAVIYSEVSAFATVVEAA